MDVSALPLKCQACRLGVASLPDACPFHEVRRAAGNVLVHQDERPSQVWYLRRGQVVLGSISESGVDQSSAVRGPDTLLGFEALLGESIPYRITALTDVTLCVIDARAFSDWVGSLDSPMGSVLTLALREASRRATERQALEGTAVRRVARFLLDRQKRNGNGALTPHHVLARVLGMRPETLSRALRELRRAGAIAPGRGVRVADSLRLEQLAGA